ncbi:hypothetical protein [Curtobacterium pusillum]|uniref:hypothetical protein n=1 Tax=Curtobacterium pusillum TaxID=69373 RepID=UPI0031D64BF0
MASFGRNATGTVHVWCRSATQAGLTAAVAGFNKANPNLQVELTPVPDAQYVTKLATAIRGVSRRTSWTSTTSTRSCSSSARRSPTSPTS